MQWKPAYNLRVDPLHPRFLYKCCFTSVSSTNCRLCNTVVFTIEKNLHISGLVQFKLCRSRVNCIRLPMTEEMSSHLNCFPEKRWKPPLWYKLYKLQHGLALHKTIASCYYNNFYLFFFFWDLRRIFFTSRIYYELKLSGSVISSLVANYSIVRDQRSFWALTDHSLILGHFSHLSFRIPHSPGSLPTSLIFPSHTLLLVPYLLLKLLTLLCSGDQPLTLW